jgi:glycosyltransferase involved in cell wall biosynthesis
MNFDSQAQLSQGREGPPPGSGRVDDVTGAAPLHPRSAGPLAVLEVTGTAVGGSAEHIAQLVRATDPAAVHYAIIYKPGGPQDQDLKELGAPDLSPGSHGSASYKQAFDLNLLSYFWRVGTQVRSGRFDIIHTHTTLGGLAGRLSTLGLRNPPIRVHMCHAFASGGEHRGWKARALNTLEKALDHVTDFYIVGSEAAERKGRALGVIRGDNVRMIFYAVDPAPYLEISDGGEPAAVGDAETFKVVFAGRLEPQKDPLAAIEVLNQARALTSRALELWILGDGSLRDDVERLAKAYSIDVKFFGWVASVASYLKTADCLLLTSQWETFGIVNLEAMLLEKPVVSFATEGVPEVVLDGETGLLAPLDDREMLSKHLARLANDPAYCVRLGQAGKKRAISDFTSEVMARQHVELFVTLSGNIGLR